MALLKLRPCGARPILAGDFAPAMLRRGALKFGSPGTHKWKRKTHADGKPYAVAIEADALRLPLRSESLDLIVTAFGFRNLANYEEGLREIARVLKPGGEVGILEFTEPSSGPMAGIFRFYFQRILPRIGGAISGNSEAYKYLPGSVAKFPSPSGLAALMEKVGFTGVRIVSWNFGSVILHSARRNTSPLP